jgi:hypothetical protein
MIKLFIINLIKNMKNTAKLVYKQWNKYFKIYKKIILLRNV